MKLPLTLLAMSGALQLGGCAAPTDGAPTLREEGTMVTGSNIPRRERGTKSGVQTFDKDAVTDLLRSPSPQGKPGG